VANKRDRKRQKRLDQGRSRQQSGQLRQRGQKARALVEELEAADRQLEELTGDPARLAERLVELLGKGAFKDFLLTPETGLAQGRHLAAEVGTEQASAVAAKLAAQASHTPSALWWAVGFYAGSGDLAKAEELASAELERAGLDKAGPGVARVVGQLRFELGQWGRLTDLARSLLKDDPDDPDNVGLFVRTLVQLYEDNLKRSSEGRAPDPAGEAVLAGFADRSRLERLRGTMAGFLEDNPKLAEWAELAREEWHQTFLETAGLDEWDKLSGQSPFAPTGAAPSEGELASALENLAAECLWTSSPEDAHRDDDSHSLLNLFAANPGTPADLAELARDWQSGVRYGLWQLAEPVASPGAWVTDLVTRRTMYASLPPELLTALPRWSVLATCFFPDQGIWRSGGGFAVLDPAEADRAAEVALALSANFVGFIAKEAGLKGAKKFRTASPRLDNPPPHGIIAGLAEPLEETMADMLSKVVCVALPNILGQIWATRRPPRLVNTDREPLELLQMTARVPDASTLRAALGRRPDFDVEGNGGAIAWLGREMTPLEDSTSRAEIHRMAIEGGLGPVEVGPAAQRWVRGILHLDGDRLTVEVNSRARLEAVTRLLSRLGVQDPVVERRLDPSLDVALPAGWRPMTLGGSPGSEEVWRRHWLDEEVPALGTTPRKAVNEAETAVRLESLLRQFEFDADLTRASGKRPLDVGAIRAALAGEDGEPFRL
jgi:hypothetical protein